MKVMLISLLAALVLIGACGSDSTSPNPDTSMNVSFCGISGDTSTVNIGWEVVGVTSGSGSYTFGENAMPTEIAYPGDSLWLYVSSGYGLHVYGSISVNDTSVVHESDTTIVIMGYRIPE